MTAKTIGAGAFKARCLELMDRVADTGEVIVITKRGRPVAQLSAVTTKPASLLGHRKDEIEFVGDVIAPVDVEWGPSAPAHAAAKTRNARGR
jgi:prevent-host-death family protein